MVPVYSAGDVLRVNVRPWIENRSGHANSLRSHEQSVLLLVTSRHRDDNVSLRCSCGLGDHRLSRDVESQSQCCCFRDALAAMHRRGGSGFGSVVVVVSQLSLIHI